MPTLTEQATQTNHEEETVIRTNLMLACRIKVCITLGRQGQEANKIAIGLKDLKPKTFKEEAVLGDQ